MMPQLDNLIGQSDNFIATLEHASRLAPLNRPVLILGERGTGKELIAKRLHFLSKRWDGPLISLNCAALSDGLIDSELFGHEAGSFSGAKGRHRGRFERAEGGSLLLDEIATAPIAVQEKLLRVIEYGEFERVGGGQILRADVRLICATNENLSTLAQEGKFRADLLDRLAFDVIHLPPLRQRQGDILLLAEHYAQKMCRELGYHVFNGFSASAKQTLLDYHWPGNVRELKNVVERAVYRHANEHHPIAHIILDPFMPPWGSTLSNKHDQPQPQASALISPHRMPTTNTLEPNLSLPIALRQWQQQQEKQLVEHALEAAKFNQGQAAQSLGISYHQLRGLLKKHHLIGEKNND